MTPTRFVLSDDYYGEENVATLCCPICGYFQVAPVRRFC